MCYVQLALFDNDNNNLYDSNNSNNNLFTIRLRDREMVLVNHMCSLEICFV